MRSLESELREELQTKEKVMRAMMLEIEQLRYSLQTKAGTVTPYGVYMSTASSQER